MKTITGILLVTVLLLFSSCGGKKEINAMGTFNTLNPDVNQFRNYKVDVSDKKEYVNAGIDVYSIPKGDTFLEVQYKGERNIFTLLRFKSSRPQTELLIDKLVKLYQLKEGYFDDAPLDTNSFKSFTNDDFALHVKISDTAVSLEKFRGDEQ